MKGQRLGSDGFRGLVQTEQGRVRSCRESERQDGERWLRATTVKLTGAFRHASAALRRTDVSIPR
jgi:hypothetical protein